MKIFYGTRLDVVQFANALLLVSEGALQSITITRQGTSGVYSVSIVTDTSLEDIVETLAQTCSLQDMNTWLKSTRAG